MRCKVPACPGFSVACRTVLARLHCSPGLSGAPGTHPVASGAQQRWGSSWSLRGPLWPLCTPVLHWEQPRAVEGLRLLLSIFAAYMPHPRLPGIPVKPPEGRPPRQDLGEGRPQAAAQSSGQSRPGRGSAPSWSWCWKGVAGKQSCFKYFFVSDTHAFPLCFIRSIFTALLGS